MRQNGIKRSSFGRFCLLLTCNDTKAEFYSTNEQPGVISFNYVCITHTWPTLLSDFDEKIKFRRDFGV
jgi:hypothetical protein